MSRKRRAGASVEVCAGGMRNDLIVFPFDFQGITGSFSGGLADALRLSECAPEAVWAPLPQALELADLKLTGQIQLGSLGFAFVVLTDPAHPNLNFEHRDLLWRAFQVPIFEQFRSSQGTILARECETHDGLHIVAASEVEVEEGELRIDGSETGLSALLDTGHCECGNEAPRLTVGGPLRKKESEEQWVREAAA